MPDPNVTPNEEVKDNVVIIDGKPRPLKDYEAEMKRKSEEEVQRVKEEYEQKMASLSTRQPEVTNQSARGTGYEWLEEYSRYGENEIATSGRTIPVQTIAHLASQISARAVQETLKTRDEADRSKRRFVKEISKADPEFKHIEDEFYEIADQLPHNQVNPQTLQVIYQASRSKRLETQLKEVQEKAKKNAELNPEIIGNPTEGGSSRGASSSALTAAQRQELANLDREGSLGLDEEWYLRNLKRKQEQAKADGKNIPTTLHGS